MEVFRSRISKTEYRKMSLPELYGIYQRSNIMQGRSYLCNKRKQDEKGDQVSKIFCLLGNGI